MPRKVIVTEPFLGTAHWFWKLAGAIVFLLVISTLRN